MEKKQTFEEYVEEARRKLLEYHAPAKARPDLVEELFADYEDILRREYEAGKMPPIHELAMAL